VSWLELMLAAVQAIAAGLGALNAWMNRRAGADAVLAAARGEQAAEEKAAIDARNSAEAAHARVPDDSAFDQDFRRG